jgi:uncharacterized protein YndB with AHSA1/START domain
MRPRFLPALALLAIAAPVHAEVTDKQSNGFAIHQSVTISATPDKVYAALIKPGAWWSSTHSYSHDARNITIDAKAGGCFCEKLANGGSVQHGVITAVVPGAELRVRGPIGPLADHGLDGALIFALKAEGTGTVLTLDDSVGGYMKGGLGPWPELVDGVLAEQVSRLKALLETGSPETKKP